MTKKMNPSAPSLQKVAVRASRVVGLLVLAVAWVVLHIGCTCAPESSPASSRPIACRPQHPTRPTVTSGAPRVATAAAGAVSARFAASSTGSATLVMPFATSPGRGGLEPAITLRFDSAAGDGVLGVGFSITAGSAITRCPSTLRDGEIRDVRYDAFDRLCLDSRRLVVVGKEAGKILYR